MNWMKKVAVALVCLLPLGLQAAKVDTLQVKSPSMNKSIEVVVVSPDMAATEACPVIYLLHGYGGLVHGSVSSRIYLRSLMRRVSFLYARMVRIRGIGIAL